MTIPQIYQPHHKTTRDQLESTGENIYDNSARTVLDVKVMLKCDEPQSARKAHMMIALEP